MTCTYTKMPPADISTPPVAIPPLGIEVSAQPTVLSVSGGANIPSNHDAIGMTGSFWVGIGQAKETRVVSRGNLYLAGTITVEPIGGKSASSLVTMAMVGDGKVRWQGVAAMGLRVCVLAPRA